MFDKSIKQLHEMLINKEIKPSDLYKFAIDNYDKKNNELNVIITKFQHENIDDIEINNVLSGIPFSIKDNFNTNGYRTTAASKILENYLSNYDSTVFKTLNELGSIGIGKDNMDEFANGISTKSSYFGPTINPNWKDRLVGGSSGGSAASVASGMSMFSIGTETGGSVRLPAAWNGIVGFKPTYGLISRYGLISFASSLDTVGIFAKTVDDVSVVFDQLIQKDYKDSTNIGYNKKSQDIINDNIDDLKIAVLDDYENLDVDKNIISAINDVVKNFDNVNSEKIVHFEHTSNIYYAIACTELFSNLNRFDGIRYGTNFEGEDWKQSIINTRQNFSTEVKKRIMIGASLVSSEENKKLLSKSKIMRQELKQSLDDILERNDVLILPVTSSLPPKIDEEITPELLNLTDQFTIISSLSGTPAISIPYGYNEEGLPIAIQIVSKAFNDDKLLNIAHKIYENKKGDN